MNRSVVITGIGLISSLGEGTEVHLAAARGAVAAVHDSAQFAPYTVHPLAAIDFDSQIPKKSDQRQMELWQRIGVHAAGLALESAGLKQAAELRASMGVIVAAGGGERDHEVDGQILTGLRTAEQPGDYLNERLAGDLRPTLFLAQLSNLLAGNISIVHAITGPSRTFMGEEQAGVDAIRIAQARIAAGQGDLMLVGGSYNAARADMMLLLQFGRALATGPVLPVFARGEGSAGMVMGSVGCFLVLEAADHAVARGARSLARIGPVAAGRARRAGLGVEEGLVALGAELGLGDRPVAGCISAASGVAPWTAQERQALARLAPDVTPVAVGDMLGHALEAAFPAATALAALRIAAGDLTDVLVSGVGHWRGEGLVRLDAAPGMSPEHSA